MALSLAKAQAVTRDLKEKLELRGYTVAQSNITNGIKLLINADEASIRFIAKDAISKDIFGNDLKEIEDTGNYRSDNIRNGDWS